MDPSWEPHAPTYQVHENTISALLVVHVHGDAEVKADDAPTGQTGPVGGTWRPQQGSENGSHIGGRWNHSISLCLRSKYFLRRYFTWRIDLISKDHPHRIHGNGIFEYKYHKNWSNGGRYASPIYYRHLDPLGHLEGVGVPQPRSLGEWFHWLVAWGFSSSDLWCPVGFGRLNG